MVSNLDYFQYTFGMSVDFIPKFNIDKEGAKNTQEKPKEEIPKGDQFVQKIMEEEKILFEQKEKTPEQIKKDEAIKNMLGGKTPEFKKQSVEFFEEKQAYKELVSKANIEGVQLPLSFEMITDFQKDKESELGTYEVFHAMIGSTPPAGIKEFAPAGFSGARNVLHDYIKDKLSKLSEEKRKVLETIPEFKQYL